MNIVPPKTCSVFLFLTSRLLGCWKHNCQERWSHCWLFIDLIHWFCSYTWGHNISMYQLSEFAWKCFSKQFGCIVVGCWKHNCQERCRSHCWLFTDLIHWFCSYTWGHNISMYQLSEFAWKCFTKQFGCIVV